MKVNINAQLRHLPVGENRVQESANPGNFQSDAKLSSERGKGGGGAGEMQQRMEGVGESTTGWRTKRKER